MTQYEPEPDSDEDDEPEPSEDEEYEATSGKRKSLGDGGQSPKRRRTDAESRRMSREQRDDYAARLERHYMAGTWYGQSASGTIFVLATVLERVDNELLWCALNLCPHIFH